MSELLKSKSDGASMAIDRLLEGAQGSFFDVDRQCKSWVVQGKRSGASPPVLGMDGKVVSYLWHQRSCWDSWWCARWIERKSPQTAAATVWTDTDVDSSEHFQQRFVTVTNVLGAVWPLRGLSTLKRFLSDHKPGVDVARSEQAVVPDLHETVGQNVLQKTADELLRGHRGGFVAARGDSDSIVEDLADAMV